MVIVIRTTEQLKIVDRNLEAAFFVGFTPEVDPRISGLYIMADEIKGDELTPQESPPAEESEPTQPESQDQTPQADEDTQSEATSESQTEADDNDSSSKETGDQSEQQGAKQTRSERRIKDLLAKVKQVGSVQEQPVPQQPYTPTQNEGTGEVELTQEQLQQLIRTETQNALEVDRARQQFESTVREHQQDLESVKDLDPDLEAEAVAEYEALNNYINPLTGQKEFIPTVKLSEVVSKIQKRAEKYAEKLAEQRVLKDNEHLKDVASNQAVPSGGQVSGSKSIDPGTTDFKEFEKAYSS